ncbi:MAG: hypothetical protein GQ527_10710 [Bacteroidales bacterium]|nr:hypothetical protein [Bacteroidales bacterium]
MEIYRVNITYDNSGPYEIVLSAMSVIDAKNKINEKYSNCEIISVKELYAT